MARWMRSAVDKDNIEPYSGFSLKSGFGSPSGRPIIALKSNTFWRPHFPSGPNAHACAGDTPLYPGSCVKEVGLLCRIGAFATCLHTSSDMDLSDNHNGILMIFSNALRCNSTVNPACLRFEALLRNGRQRPGFPSEALSIRFAMAPSPVIIRVIPRAHVVRLSAIPSSVQTVAQARQDEGGMIVRSRRRSR